MPFFSVPVNSEECPVFIHSEGQGLKVKGALRKGMYIFSLCITLASLGSLKGGMLINLSLLVSHFVAYSPFYLASCPSLSLSHSMSLLLASAEGILRKR